MATENNKPHWLDRVKAKATYNHMRRLRLAEEDAKFKAELDGGFQDPQAPESDQSEPTKGKK